MIPEVSGIIFFAGKGNYYAEVLMILIVIADIGA